MNRALFIIAFLLGAAAILWMAADFIGSNPLALVITIVIGAVYIIGIVELLYFRSATASLTGALQRPAADRAGLDNWIAALHPSLQNAVRLRIEGERVGLPAPVFTPYLVGLLVMLGLLGTFVGMVETLHGAVSALQGSTELEAIRNGLAAPIEGLGLAFGTSVAGVAASATLGLNATLCRRERMLATRTLDTLISGNYREHSLNYARHQAFSALQIQADALPAAAGQLASTAQTLEQMGARLQQSLLDNQKVLFETTDRRLQTLLDTVEQSLQSTLADSGRAAAEAVTPVMTTALGDIRADLATTQRELATAAEKQLQAMRDNNQAATEAQLSKLSDLLRASEELVSERIEAEQAWAEGHEQRQAQLVATLQRELEAARDAEVHRADAAVQRLGDLEQGVADHLSRLGRELEAPMARLMESAAETPRTAARVIGEMREETAGNIEHYNALLEQQSRLMERLASLAETMEDSAGGQREAVSQLVTNSSELLEQLGTRLGDRVAQEVSQVSESAAEMAGNAAEVASLGEAFAASVDLFAASNEKLIESLGRIEHSLGDASGRSDEQMGYYVAQAREIIDQSMLSQRQVIEELRQLGSTGELFTAETG